MKNPLAKDYAMSCPLDRRHRPTISTPIVGIDKTYRRRICNDKQHRTSMSSFTNKSCEGDILCNFTIKHQSKHDILPQ